VQGDVNLIIEKNLGLVYSQLKRFGLIQDQDAESIAYEALYKAVIGFDDSKTNSFSTYATVCIYNALGCYMRQVNKVRKLDVISYNDKISDGEGGTTELLNFIPAEDNIEDVLVKQELNRCLYTTIKELYKGLSNEKHKKIVLNWIVSGYSKTTVQLAQDVHVSQSYASQVIQRFKSNIRKRMEAQING
jgi:RNA polymerase sigma factor (sigma-70 family)